MGPKAYALKNSGTPTKESSWMDRMCQKIETYCDLGEPGRGPSLIFQVCIAFSWGVFVEASCCCKPCIMRLQIMNWS